MSPASIFLIGVFTAALLAVFVYETIHQLRRAGQQRPQGTMIGTGAPGIPDRTPAASHPMRVLVATDGSPCSDAAVQSVAWRPWPPGSEIEVVTVVHSKVPYIPDPALVGPAAYETALEEDRRDAPARARAAERALADLPGLAVTSTVLEGDPAKIIAREADRWGADLVVVGSHGYGPLKRLVLGSVSRDLAAHAPCSVEIVRCRSAV